MLKLAEARARAEGLDSLTFVCADVAAVDSLFPSASFDLVLAHSLLEFLPNPAVTLSSLVCLLAPGGTLSLVFGNRHHFPLRYALRDLDAVEALESLTADEYVAGTDLFGQARRVFDPNAVKDMVTEAGLQVAGVYGLRVLSDLVPDGYAEQAEWRTLEAAAGAHPTLRSIARFIQIIGVK